MNPYKQESKRLGREREEERERERKREERTEDLVMPTNMAEPNQATRVTQVHMLLMIRNIVVCI